MTRTLSLREMAQQFPIARSSSALHGPPQLPSLPVPSSLPRLIRLFDVPPLILVHQTQQKNINVSRYYKSKAKKEHSHSQNQSEMHPNKVQQTKCHIQSQEKNAVRSSHEQNAAPNHQQVQARASQFQSRAAAQAQSEAHAFQVSQQSSDYIPPSLDSSVYATPYQKYQQEQLQLDDLRMAALNSKRNVKGQMTKKRKHTINSVTPLLEQPKVIKTLPLNIVTPPLEQPLPLEQPKKNHRLPPLTSSSQVIRIQLELCKENVNDKRDFSPNGCPIQAQIAALKRKIHDAEMKKDMRLMKTKRTSQSGIHIIINEFIMVSLIYA